jgi:hypothetical protein
MDHSKLFPKTASKKDFLNSLFISSKGLAVIANVSIESLDAMAASGTGPRFVMKHHARRYSLAACGQWMAARHQRPSGGLPNAPGP